MRCKPSIYSKESLKKVQNRRVGQFGVIEEVIVVWKVMSSRSVKDEF